jgi:hypothetical protein
VTAAATILMASPAFAATIKLGGDSGELGFYVSALGTHVPFPANVEKIHKEKTLEAHVQSSSLQV